MEPAIRFRKFAVRVHASAIAGRALARSAALALLVTCTWGAPAQSALAQEAALERLQVTDPYLELRTGPGRGYPRFFVVERLQWIEIQLRHTDWYKVRTADGKEGWVERGQLESTLTQAGTRRSFRDVLLDDYLRRRVEMGAAWGHFSGDPVIKLWGSYNLSDLLALELAAGQVQGTYSGTDFWQLDLLAQPWADRRLQPFFGIGVGRINNVPSASLVNAVSSSSNMSNAMIGARYHVSERLILRLDWTAYVSLISASRTDQYHALTAGLSFFF